MKDILDSYGSDSRQSQAGRSGSGGVTEAKPLPYSPPVGPTNQMRERPGLGGDNHGCCGSQGRY